MINAIEARKPDEAEKAAHEHTMLFQRRFLAYLQQNLTEKMSVSGCFSHWRPSAFDGSIR
jgi:hypothetical protein